MKRHTLLPATAALVAALAAAPALAADAEVPTRGPIPYGSFDADRDGRVTREEFDRAHSERYQKRATEQRQYRYMGERPQFTDIDSSGDGALSRAEVEAHQKQRQQMRQQQFQQRHQDASMNMPSGSGSGTPSRGGGRK